MLNEINSSSQGMFRKNVTATVKWFNPKKGFGFVVPEDGSSDAFCHITAVRQAGHDTLPDGTTIVCDLEEGQRGFQVSEIHSVDVSTAVEAPTSFSGYDRPAFLGQRAPRRREFDDNGATDELEGTVKFFNTNKGYGFIASDSGGKDVFVHVSALSRSGLVGLSEEQRVRVSVRQGDRGPEAVHLDLI
jgi:CspA family cold shock protein